MAQILRNKNLATKFQILVQIAANQPNIQQKDITQKLDITPQAVSEYIKEMVKDGSVTSDGRSRYRITTEGVNRVLKALIKLRGYLTFVERAVTNITVCAAVAAIEAAHSGLSFLILCTDDSIPALLKRLEEQNLSYEILDLSTGSNLE